MMCLEGRGNKWQRGWIQKIFFLKKKTFFGDASARFYCGGVMGWKKREEWEGKIPKNQL